MTLSYFHPLPFLRGKHETTSVCPGPNFDYQALIPHPVEWEGEMLQALRHGIEINLRWSHLSPREKADIRKRYPGKLSTRYTRVTLRRVEQ